MRITVIQNIKRYRVTSNQVTKTMRVQVNQQINSFKITISPLGKQGIQGKSAYQIAVENGFVGTEVEWLDSIGSGKLVKISGENINSHTPVALVDNLAYKLDASNPQHQFAFVGFTEASSTIGNQCVIKQVGEIYLGGWGLMPNQHYLAGINGTLITSNVSSSNFTKVIGFASTSETLQIIKDSITINK